MTALHKTLDGSREQYASYHFRRFYDYSPREYERWKRKYTFYFKDLLPSDRSAKILDLGCGGGRFLYFLKSLGYSHIAGVDSEEMQLRALRAAVGCQAYQSDVLEFLASTTEQYDLLSCHHVIEHLSREDSAELLDLIHRSLVPGGRLILSTPNALRPWAGWHLFGDLSHDHLFTPSSLKESLEVAGFQAVQLKSEGAVPSDPLAAMRWLLWKVWREPYLKLTFALDNGFGCLAGSRLIVSEGIIASACRPLE